MCRCYSQTKWQLQKMLYYGINYSDLKGFKYIERSIRKKVEQTEVRFKIQGNRKHV
jgi:hypothetical protein